jgi:ABC-type antimicrobial peptide transport system permease subunit
MNIRLNRNLSASEALATVQKVFRNVLPSVPFEYRFVDEEYNLKFAAEERIGKLAAFFGGLALFISCLGLFGLASFVASRRTKEVGIRKVLGATVANLLRLLLAEFIWLTLIACAVAIPLSIYLLNQWLQKFAYRTGISWSVVLFVCGMSIAVTVLAVAFQSIRAALTNPAQSLRSE